MGHIIAVKPSDQAAKSFAGAAATRQHQPQ